MNNGCQLHVVLPGIIRKGRLLDQNSGQIQRIHFCPTKPSNNDSFHKSQMLKTPQNNLHKLWKLFQGRFSSGCSRNFKRSISELLPCTTVADLAFVERPILIRNELSITRELSLLDSTFNKTWTWRWYQNYALSEKDLFELEWANLQQFIRIALCISDVWPLLWEWTSARTNTAV